MCISLGTILIASMTSALANMMDEEDENEADKGYIDYPIIKDPKTGKLIVSTGRKVKR